jgi:ribosomal protein S18 acetylase RimI-like enzyme
MSTALPRLARIDDASRIHGLLWASRKEIGLKDNFVDQSHMNWVRERCAAGEVLVVDREGAIASVMVLRSDAHVTNMATAERSRRSGLARVLMQHAKSVYPGLWAEAMPGNANAIALLRSEGFRQNEALSTAPFVGFEWGAGRPRPTIGPDWYI